MKAKCVGKTHVQLTMKIRQLRAVLAAVDSVVDHMEHTESDAYDDVINLEGPLLLAVRDLFKGETL